MCIFGMAVTVRRQFFVFMILHCIVLNYCQELSKCVFNFSFQEESVLYNFSRLSARDEWKVMLGDHTSRAYIAVCHPFSTLEPCTNSSCLVKYENGTWFVMLSDIGAYQKDLHSKPRNLLMDLSSTQPCREGRNYSVKFDFKCSSREEGPIFLDVKDGCTLLLMWKTPASCPVNSQCVYGDYDLSSLQHPDHYVVQTWNGSTFHLNVCGAIRSDLCGVNDITACEVIRNPKENKSITIGKVQNQRLTLSRDGVLVLSYFTPNKGPRTDIKFVCNTSTTESTPVLISRAAKIFLFEIETPLACSTLPQECIVNSGNGNRFDLSPLRKIYGNWDIQPTSSGVQYHLNICGPLNVVGQYSCADGVTGACQTNVRTGMTISLGYSSGPRTVTGNELVVTYTGGSSCPKGGRHSAYVKFSCFTDDLAPVFQEETSTCVHHFLWQTTAACSSMLAVGHNCIVTEMFHGHQFNLNKLHSRRTLTTESGETYNINVCGPLDTLCHGQNASVCLTREGRQYAIGYENSSLLYENGGLRFELHGEGCKPGKASSTIIVILICNHGSDLGEPEPFPIGDDCNFYFVWHTSTACTPAHTVDCTVTNNGDFYDLSPLKESRSNHLVILPKSKLKFLLNVCHSVVFGQDMTCEYTSAACMVNTSDPDITTRFTDIGDVDRGPYFENGKLKLKYDNGDMCNHPDGPDHLSTVITFECDYIAESELVPLQGGVCVYEFLWRTRYACPINATAGPQNGDCTLVDPITHYRIDLRPLQSQVQTVSGAGHNYTFVACGNLKNGPCGSVGVCQTAEPSQFWSAGAGNSNLQYRAGAMYLNYTGGALCDGQVSRSTVIEFVCAMDSDSERVFVDEIDNCSFFITWHTTLACSRQMECITPVDLSSLVRVDDNYIVRHQDGTTFYINVCRPVLPMPGLLCPEGSMACLKQDSIKSLGHIPMLTRENDGNVTLTYTGGSPCDLNPKVNVALKMHFVCDPRSGKGEPQFSSVSDHCQYEFIWMTSITCKPFRKVMSAGTCMLHNEQLDGSMNLKILDEMHVLGEERNYTLTPCSPHAGVLGEEHSNIGKSFGTLTTAVFDYHNEQVSLQFTGGSNCSATSSETYWAQILLKCNAEASSRTGSTVTESDCGVVMEWSGAAACDVLLPHVSKSASSHVSGVSVELVVVLIILAAILCLLVLYLRKPANRSQLKSRLSLLFGVRHDGRFHYSRESDGEWSER